MDDFSEQSRLSSVATAATVVGDPINFNELERIAPYLDWRNAAQVPWSECVRNPNTQPVPVTDSQQAYFANNIDMRLELLTMTRDMATGQLATAADFKQRFAGLNRVLVIGNHGNSIYMNPDHKLKLDRYGKSPSDVAGVYGDWNIPTTLDAELEELFGMISSFVAETNIRTHSRDQSVTQVGRVYFDNLNKYGIRFSYGNNSMNMNITNGLLRLLGLNGISHHFLDIEFMSGMSADRFDESFAAEVRAANPVTPPTLPQTLLLER